MKSKLNDAQLIAESYASMMKKTKEHAKKKDGEHLPAEDSSCASDEEQPGEDAENEAAFDAQKEKVKAMFDQQILDEVNAKLKSALVSQALIMIQSGWQH